MKKQILKNKRIFYSKEGGMVLKNIFNNWKPTFFKSWDRSRPKTDRLRNTD